MITPDPLHFLHFYDGLRVVAPKSMPGTVLIYSNYKLIGQFVEYGIPKGHLDEAWRIFWGKLLWGL